MLFTYPQLGDHEAKVLDEIMDMRKKLAIRLNEPRRWFGPLRRHLETEAVRASTAIEGIVADLDDTAAIRAGEVPATLEVHDRMALQGYWDVMTYVLQQAKNEDFTYNTALILSMHFMMTKHDLDNRPGLWRAGQIFVRDSKAGATIYEGPSAEDVPELMGELLTSLEENSSGSAIIDGALAHLNLAMIHPFRDGNGRMARCLQSLVIARDGALSPVFVSVEAYLGRNTQQYYDVLATVGTRTWHPSERTTPWVRFMLTAHYNEAATVLRRIAESERIWADLEALAAPRKLHERTLSALYDATVGYRVTRNTYLAALAGEISEQGATRDLQRLSESGLLEARGERRGRFYVAGPELLRIRSETRTPQERLDSLDPFA